MIVFSKFTTLNAINSIILNTQETSLHLKYFNSKNENKSISLDFDFLEYAQAFTEGIRTTAGLAVVNENALSKVDLTKQL
jgi:hypothetical protein